MTIIVPPVLRDLVSAEQCVSYIGAGFSMPCGMPTWVGLLNSIIHHAERANYRSQGRLTKLDQARAFVRSGELPVAAAILRKLISRTELNRIIETQYNISVFQESNPIGRNICSNRLYSLLSSSFAGIITTNYDTLIEYGISNFSNAHFKQCSMNDIELGDMLCDSKGNTKFFVKIHGSVTGGGYVLSTEEYSRVYLRNKAVRYFLIGAMLKYHLIFLGCSLEDEIVSIRRELGETYSGNIPLAYAILPDSEYNQARADWLYDHAMIQSVLFSPKKTGRKIARHGYLDRVLEELAASEEPAFDSNSLSTGELARTLVGKDIETRLKLVGEKNRGLVRFVRTKDGLYHGEVEELKSTRGVPSAVRSMGSEEIYYRLQFLISVGVVCEERDTKGRLRYIAV